MPKDGSHPGVFLQSLRAAGAPRDDTTRALDYCVCSRVAPRHTAGQTQRHRSNSWAQDKQAHAPRHARNELPVPARHRRRLFFRRLHRGPGKGVRIGKGCASKIFATVAAGAGHSAVLDVGPGRAREIPIGLVVVMIVGGRGPGRLPSSMAKQQRACWRSVRTWHTGGQGGQRARERKSTRERERARARACCTLH